MGSIMIVGSLENSKMNDDSLPFFEGTANKIGEHVVKCFDAH